MTIKPNSCIRKRKAERKKFSAKVFVPREICQAYQSAFELLSQSGLIKTTIGMVKLWVLELQRVNFRHFSKAELKYGTLIKDILL